MDRPRATPLLALLVATTPSLSGCFFGLIGLTTAAEHATYFRGALLRTERGRRVGCLELAPSIESDPDLPPARPVIGLDLGNACGHPIRVDLARLRVTARYGAEAPVPLAVYDPFHELARLPLDARERGTESLAFAPAAGHAARPDAVCVDFSSVDVDATTARAAPVCFHRDGERMLVDAAGATP